MTAETTHLEDCSHCTVSFKSIYSTEHVQCTCACIGLYINSFEIDGGLRTWRYASSISTENLEIPSTDSQNNTLRLPRSIIHLFEDIFRGAIKLIFTYYTMILGSKILYKTYMFLN